MAHVLNIVKNKQGFLDIFKKNRYLYSILSLKIDVNLQINYNMKTNPLTPNIVQ